MEGGQKQSSFDGLENHVYLEKQDQLRDLGVDISTSQVRYILPSTYFFLRLTFTVGLDRSRGQPVVRQELPSREPDWLRVPSRPGTLHPIRNPNHPSTPLCQEHRHLNHSQT